MQVAQAHHRLNQKRNLKIMTKEGVFSLVKTPVAVKITKILIVIQRVPQMKLMHKLNKRMLLLMFLKMTVIFPTKIN